jgi:hypothetical protein
MGSEPTSLGLGLPGNQWPLPAVWRSPAREPWGRLVKRAGAASDFILELTGCVGLLVLPRPWTSSLS